MTGKFGLYENDTGRSTRDRRSEVRRGWPPQDDGVPRRPARRGRCQSFGCCALNQELSASWFYYCLRLTEAPRGIGRAPQLSATPGPSAAGQAQHLLRGPSPPHFRPPQTTLVPYSGARLSELTGLTDQQARRGRKGLDLFALEAVARPGPAGQQRCKRTTIADSAQLRLSLANLTSIEIGTPAISWSGSAAEWLCPDGHTG